VTRSKPGTIRALRAAATRTRLISAATECFAKRGFHGTDLRSVSAGAQLSTGAVFAHFDGKEDLFATCFPDDHQRRRVAEAVCLALGEAWEPDLPFVEYWLRAADSVLLGDDRRVAAKARRAPSSPARVIEAAA